MLTGADATDVAAVFDIGQSTVYKILEDVVNAFNKVLKLRGLPFDRSALSAISHGFKASRENISPLDGCVGALDNICFRIRSTQKESNHSFFFSRKGFHAISVQAVCDSNYRFLVSRGFNTRFISKCRGNKVL